MKRLCARVVEPSGMVGRGAFRIAQERVPWVGRCLEFISCWKMEPWNEKGSESGVVSKIWSRAAQLSTVGSSSIGSAQAISLYVTNLRGGSLLGRSMYLGLGIHEFY